MKFWKERKKGENSETVFERQLKSVQKCEQ